MDPGRQMEYQYEPYDEDYYEDDFYEDQTMYGKVSEHVQTNLIYLRRALQDGKVVEMQNIYESTLCKIIDDPNTLLPPASNPLIADILGDDELFTIIYNELFFRQIYATDKPSLQDRFDSYQNYVNFFNYILSSQGPVALELPNQWLWEIMDDFIYQFQSFSVYLSRVDKMDPSELEQCRQHPKMWNVHSVLNVLHSLVKKSNISQQLEVYSNGGNPEDVAGEYGSRPLYKMLGYFSLIALLRLHSQLGDYYQAIKVLRHLELNRKGLARVPACHVSTYYYVGFAYMMMRRYEDAIRTFSDVLVYILRSKATLSQSRNYQQKQMNKQMEQMFALLSICLVLHPQRTDESVLNELKARHSDITVRMTAGDLDSFEKQFMFGCPRFLSPVSPIIAFDLEQMTEEQRSQLARQPQLQQWLVFRDELRAQQHMPDIRGFLKLYTTMPVEKLARFIQPLDLIEEGKPTMLSEQEILKHHHRRLMSFKHLTSHASCSSAASAGNQQQIEGEFQSGSDMDFFIDRDMIHIADTKVARRYGEFFIRQFHNFEKMHDTVKKLAH